jgi:collagen type I/II/III/V/XI/XXIV/XXVII alpha
MADTFNWATPGSSGTFDVASDWIDATDTAETGVLFPGSSDIANLTGPATGPAQIITGPGTVAVLNVLGLNALSGNFTTAITEIDGVTNPASLTVSGSFAATGTLIVGNAGAGGMSVGSAATVTVGASSTGVGQIIIGDSGLGSGAVTISDTGTLDLVGATETTDYGFDIGDAGSGTLVVTGTGSTVNDASEDGTSVGYGTGSSGTLTINAGATADFASSNNVELTALAIGRAGAGLVTVDGAGTTLNANGGIYVGRGGQGTLVASNGAVINQTQASAYVLIGTGSSSSDDHVGGNGSATVESDATISNAGDLRVGGYGVNGQLTVESGGLVTAVTQAASSGESNGITGLVVGNSGTVGGDSLSGTGSLEIDAGGTVEIGGAAAPGYAGMAVGAGAGSTGSVLVTGAGAVLNTGSNQIDVGNAGTGTLDIADGASVNCDSPGSTHPGLIIGNAVGGIGTVSITGTGSVLDANGGLVVGLGGTGSLSVSAGGAVDASNVFISLDGGSAGTAEVTGGGSALASLGTLSVGGTASIATLSLDSGGLASAAGIGVGIGDTVALDGGTLATAGSITLAGGATIEGAGTVAGTLGGTGAITATGGTLTLTSTVLGGNLGIGAGGDLVLDSGVGSAPSVNFAGTGRLDILSPGSFDAVVGGFGVGDTIFAAGATQLGNTGGNAITLENASGTAIGTIDLLIGAPTGSFVDNDGTITFACFAEGTRIATPEGETDVQSLREGDMVLTAAGTPAPVQWVGHRKVDCRRHPRPESVWPVRIRPHAFGHGLPARDLWLSPDHAVFIDGALIPVRLLVNGTTIARERRASVTYFHVELPRHDILFAESLPCESFLDTGNRNAFANGGGAMQLHPDFAPRAWDALGCAPLVLGGKQLDRARARLRRHDPADARRA